MYRVKKHFTDLQDNRYVYHEGDIYPREGLEVSAERLAELAGTKNRRGISLIEEIIDEPLPFTEEPEEAEKAAEVTEEPKEKPKSKRGRKKG